MKLPNYRVYDLTGSYVTQDIYADSFDEAVKSGREWIEDGDFEPTFIVDEKLACKVGPIIRDAVGEIDQEATEEAEKEDCSGVCPRIKEPKCHAGTTHDWQSPYSVVQGCRENPGVWGSGHGGICIHEVCSCCGMYRITDYGATWPPNGTRCTTVKYAPPDDTSLTWVEKK